MEFSIRKGFLCKQHRKARNRSSKLVVESDNSAISPPAPPKPTCNTSTEYPVRESHPTVGFRAISRGIGLASNSVDRKEKPTPLEVEALRNLLCSRTWGSREGLG